MTLNEKENVGWIPPQVIWILELEEQMFYMYQAVF